MVDQGVVGPKARLKSRSGRRGVGKGPKLTAPSTNKAKNQEGKPASVPGNQKSAWQHFVQTFPRPVVRSEPSSLTFPSIARNHDSAASSGILGGCADQRWQEIAGISVAMLLPGSRKQSGERRHSSPYVPASIVPARLRGLTSSNSAATSGDGPGVKSVAATDAAMPAVKPGVHTMMSKTPPGPPDANPQIDDATVPAIIPDTAPQ